MTSATAGSLLKEAREARGLSLEDVAAATRVRVPYLEALEADALNQLPALVYARGYLRSYANLLELEPEPLVASLRPPREPERALPPTTGRRWRPAVSPGLVTTGVLALVVGGFALYARHELSLETVAASRPAPVLIASPAAATPPPAAANPARAAAASATTGTIAQPVDPATARAGRGLMAGEVSVTLRFTDDVWAYVVVDGSPVYGAAGRFFSTGQQVTFTGSDVSVTSGKGAATLVSVNGRSAGALPDGVTTRDYTAQT